MTRLPRGVSYRRVIAVLKRAGVYERRMIGKPYYHAPRRAVRSSRCTCPQVDRHRNLGCHRAGRRADNRVVYSSAVTSRIPHPDAHPDGPPTVVAGERERPNRDATVWERDKPRRDRKGACSHSPFIQSTIIHSRWQPRCFVSTPYRSFCYDSG